MAKEKVREMNGVFASVFAHAGHITKEEAQEITGLADSEFEKVYARGSDISERVLNFEGNKMDHFLEHYVKVVDEYMANYFGGKLFH